MSVSDPGGRVARLAGPAGELAVADGGHGEPAVLLVHELGGDAAHWSDQLAHLWRRWRAAALDLRGHGGSDASADGDYGVEALAADVEAVADGLGLGSFVLVGHGLGATVASAFAADHPERLAGLVLVDPGGDQTRLPSGELDATLAALADDPRRELRLAYSTLLIGAEPATRELVLDSLDATAAAAFSSAIASAGLRPTAQDLERYPGPKLALVGPANDTPIALFRLVETLPALPLAGGSHWPMLDRPEEVNAALEAFLETLAEG